MAYGGGKVGYVPPTQGQSLGYTPIGGAHAQWMPDYLRQTAIPTMMSNQIVDILKMRGDMPAYSYQKAQEQNNANLMANLGALSGLAGRSSMPGGFQAATEMGMRQGAGQNWLNLWRDWQERKQNQWRQDLMGLAMPWSQMQLGGLGQSMDFWAQMKNAEYMKKQLEMLKKGAMFSAIGGGLGAASGAGGGGAGASIPGKG